ncbi:minor capsid protein [Treponema pectinovorum]|uniref:minor capsid protein n=1 Tax=Treponema pectinovorum TaxID=164 RepID=UPI0021C49F44|nr:minor capsid protein [Treponema pectinovorum]
MKLLVHSCLLKKQIGVDRNRNPLYTKIVLENVRLGATFQTVRGNIGEVKADTMTLFIDAKNTLYKTESGEKVKAILIEEKDSIEWQNKNFTVRSVTPCFSQGDKPHHWEITLE